jgi:hypothetical protein
LIGLSGVFILLLRRGWHDSTLVCFTEFVHHTLIGLSSAFVLFLCRRWRDSILARCKEFIHPTLNELLRVLILSHRLSVTDDLALSAKRFRHAVDNQSARANHGGGSLTVPHRNNFPSIRLYTATQVAVHPLSYVISFFSQASCCNYSCALTAKEPPPRPAPKPYPTSTKKRGDSEPNKPPPRPAPKPYQIGTIRSNGSGSNTSPPRLAPKPYPTSTNKRGDSEPNKPPARPPPKPYTKCTTQSDGFEHHKQPPLLAPELHPTSIYQDSKLTSYRGRTDVRSFPIEHTHRVPYDDEQPTVYSVESDISPFDAARGMLQKRYVICPPLGWKTPSVHRYIDQLR